MPKWNLFSATRAITCPNGHEVTVYKRVKDALPLALTQVDAQLAAKADFPFVPNVELEGSMKKRLGKALFDIDTANRELTITFHYIYLVFQADPCSRGQYFESEITKLIEEQQRVRSFYLAMEAISDLARQGTVDNTNLLDALGVVLDRFDRNQPTQAAVTAIVKSRSVVADLWKRDDDR